MRILADSPGRAGIIGNPTDGYGGSVVSCSVEPRAQVELNTGGDALTIGIAGQNHSFGGAPSEFALAGDYFDCVRAVVQYFEIFDFKAAITVTTRIPVQAGLAGSTAVLAALVAAINAARSVALDPYTLAETVRTIELNYLKIQCGYQDQYMAIFGGLNYMDFRQKELYRSLKREVFATIEPFGRFVNEMPFLVAHTGVKRVSGSVLKPVRERWLEGDPDVRNGYRRIAELARMGKRTLIDGDWRRVGRLMNENHRIQQKLGASGEENDRLIGIALKAGAIGAKLAGAGGGGTIIALCPDRAGDVREALEDAGAPEFIPLAPSAEGVRVRMGE